MKMAATLFGRRLLFARNAFSNVPKRNKYIVLLPEIGEDLPEKNPLLKEDTKLPEFNTFAIEKCIAAIGKQAVETEHAVRVIEEKIRKTENLDIVEDVLNPIEDLAVPLEITWGIAATLYFGNQTLMPTKLFMNIQSRVLNAKSFKYMSVPIYEACKNAIKNKVELNKEQSRLLKIFLLEGKLNGLDLKRKDQFDFLNKRIHDTEKEFQDRIDGWSSQYKRTISDPVMMRDFPESFLSLVCRDAAQPSQGPWTITLKPHIVSTFLEYCPDRYLRHIVWEQMVLRGSLYNDKFYQSSSSLESIRDKRKIKAEMLGFKNFVEMSMQTKMAGSLENIYNTFDILHETAYPCQVQEIESLSKFACERGFESELEEYDVPYWGRKQLRTVYNFQNDVLKEYFTLPKVLDGLYQILESLFNLKIVEEKKVDVWHKDVRFFNTFDLSESSSEPIASFYLDAYARSEQKRLNSGSTSIKYRSKLTGHTPLVALIFNFDAPTLDKPSLLSFDDVNNLFERFGYTFRHLLSKTSYHQLSIPLEWDAIGITGGFLKNRLYETQTLKLIGEHYQTKEPLSDEMISNLKDIRSHLAGYKLGKAMYLSHLDLELHSTKTFWPQIMDRLWKRYNVIPKNKKDSHVCSFSEIFSGQWGAAYYSGLWSEMIAADAYSAFHEIPKGDLDQEKEIGKRFRDTFLALGSSESCNEIFRKFRGRDPSPLALLKQLNLKKTESITSKVESI